MKHKSPSAFLHVISLVVFVVISVNAVNKNRSPSKDIASVVDPTENIDNIESIENDGIYEAKIEAAKEKKRLEEKKREDEKKRETLKKKEVTKKKDKRKNGYNVVRYFDGSRFEGFFKNGIKHGEGKLYLDDGTIQTQMWSDGTLIDSELTKVVPQFTNGTKKYPNGTYEGEFKDGKREGYWYQQGPYGLMDNKLTGTYKNGVKVSD